MYKVPFQKLPSKTIASESHNNNKNDQSLDLIRPAKIIKVADPSRYVANTLYSNQPQQGSSSHIGVTPQRPIDRKSFDHLPLQNIRGASGHLLGQYKRQFMDPSVIPSSQSLSTITSSGHAHQFGQSNSSYPSSVQLDEEWVSCFDESAGASYYYNQKTGEASWIHPQQS